MSSELIEIFVFAGISAFLIFKLYTVLGQKTGFDPSKDRASPSVAPPSEKTFDASVEGEEEKSLSPSLKKTVAAIKKKDPHFALTTFMDGATQAFEMILEAYAKGDLKTLEKLLDPPLFKEFQTSIEKRTRQGEIMETTLVKIEFVSLTGGKVRGSIAELTVKFQTEQIHVMRNQAGHIIEGSLKQIEQVKDLWTFERNLAQSNPNWTLLKTSS